MPTFGNLSESATHNRDSCHLLKLSLVRERSCARYFCIGPAHQRGMVQQASSLLVFQNGETQTCRHVDLERGFLLKRALPMISNLIRPSATPSGSRQPRSRTLAIKTERVVGHHEAREALMLSIAGVTAIMLATNLILLILY